MRRILCTVLTVAALLAMFCAAVQADVIWEPNDRFYEQHASECTYHNCSYVVNSPEGGLNLMQSPQSSRVRAQLENGAEVSIYYVYEGSGGEWGYTEWPSGQGWLPMDSLTRLYDGEMFWNDYQEEFYEDEQAVQAFQASLTEQVQLQLYSYPESGQVVSILNGDWIDQPEHLVFSELWKDETGRVWGNVGYYKGHRGWICLSDPENDAIPAVERQQLTLYPAGKPAMPKAWLQQLALAAVLVVAVAGLSAWLLVLTRKKRRKQAGK